MFEFKDVDMRYKIWKAFAVFLGFGLWLAGCYPDKFNPESDDVGPLPTLEFSEASLEFRAVGGIDTVELVSNYRNFQVALVDEETAWCRTRVEGGCLYVTVDENLSMRERSVGISVTVGSGNSVLNKILTVYQIGMSPYVRIESGDMFFQQEGGCFTTSLTTNQPKWNVELVAGEEWCEITVVDDKIQVCCREYIGKKERIGVAIVYAGSESENTCKAKLNITQFGSEPSLIVEENIQLSAKGEERRLPIRTNQPSWEVLVPSSLDWCEVSRVGDELVLKPRANNGFDDRKTEISLVAGTFVKNLTLHQFGSDLVLMQPSDVVVEWRGGVITRAITTNLSDWRASVAAGGEWCSLLEDNDVLTLVIPEYENETGRETRVTLVAKDGDYEIRKEFNVKQLPYEFEIGGGDVEGWVPSDTIPGNIDITLQERDLLIEFYYEMNGDDWEKATNWKTGKPIGEWHGVTVTDGHVTGLELPANGLTGVLTDILSKFSHLRVLRLSGNHITGKIPREIQEMECYQKENIAPQVDVNGKVYHLEEE